MITEGTKRYEELIKETIRKVLQKEVLVILFGSMAKGSFDRQSDIDIAIYTGSEIPGKKYMELLEALGHLPILRDIDIVDIAKVENASLLKHITEEGRIWINSKGLLEDLKKRLRSMKKS